MKKLLLPVLLWASMAAHAQNALLKNPTTGAINNTGIAALCMVSDGTDVVLVAADNTTIYAIDIADKDASKATANLVTSIPNFIATKLTPLTGQPVTVVDMVVNPISKSVYILGKTGTTNQIFKVEKNGTSVTMLNLTSLPHSKLTWNGAGFVVNDMAFGNNMLYISSGSFSLDGELGWIAPPFTNNGSIPPRATTMFKSNWGGQYATKAPLETLAFGKVDNKNRLMGVTTCAPGFSIDVATLQGPGLLTVTEDFNVQNGFSKKAEFMRHDTKDWLFDLHDDKLYRIGKKFLDGSQVTANQHNMNATELRTMSGTVSPGLTADEMKQMATETYTTMALWDNYRLLLLEKAGTGALKLTKVSIENPPVPNTIGDITVNNTLHIYPNPAKGQVTINLPAGNTKAMVSIISANGSIVLTQNASSDKALLDINNLPAGIYGVSATLASGKTIYGKVTVE